MFATSSLRILRPKSLELLSRMLDTRKLLETEEGKLRDYRGLADRIQLSQDDLARLESLKSGMTRAVVAKWCQKDAAVTVADLLEALRQMDRHDVAEDASCLESLTSDCRQVGKSGY